MLPLHCDIQTFIEYAVAPYVGAWIETSNVFWPLSKVTSHPTWVRGLKPIGKLNGGTRLKSHPTWVRGLKHLVPVYLGDVSQSHPTWVRGLKLQMP